MNTVKNVHSPAGMVYHTSRVARLIDCPSCKYGTLDRRDCGMKCADCGKEFTLDELKAKHVLPPNFQ